ncbi:hypothetical protein QBC39DRAFT_297727 [Podospora conica]|nr:hypothetical protein QBC39DRAFT_297727 [Schizothecium conicum]
MHLPGAQHLFTLCVIAALSPTLSTVAAAGIQPSSHGKNTPQGRVPLLKRLRDSRIGWIFGTQKPALSWTDATTVNTRYGDEIVVRFNVTNPEEETALSHAALQLLLDVWSFNSEYVDIRIHQDDVKGLKSLLPKSLEPTVIIPDLAAAIWATYPSRTPRELVKAQRLMDGTDDLFFREYQPLLVIESWMRLLQAMFPAFTEITSIGKSYEGRDILAFRVGERSADEKGPRKTILITGGLHGREWISTSTTSYLLWSMVSAFGKDRDVTKILQHFDIVFVPVLNPDGYEYTWEKDRLWRKSRQQTKMRFCRGLDLDHAFGYEWEAAQHRTDPCSESYGGDEPFQAVEASVLANWAKNQTENNVKFIGFLDLHSYSQQILFPYAYSCSVDPPNRENLEELAIGLAKAIHLSSGDSYTVASACEGAVAGVYTDRLEAGGGAAIDWFYHELKARYSYQVKLRDTGSYGFLLPKEHIIPTGKEMLNALKYFGDFLLGNNGIESAPVRGTTPDDRKDLKRRDFTG